MSDKRANVKINPKLHEQMKQLTQINGSNLTEEYEKAIENHLQDKAQKSLLKESNLESLLDEKLSKIDKHLASMIAKTGIDVAMTLLGVVYLNEAQYKTDKEKIIKLLREDGAKYYTAKS
jgi:hypothetical protein